MDRVGQEKELHRMTFRNQFFWLPMLVDFEVTSEATTLYNCFAWALGDNSRWIDPTVDYGYWPEHIPKRNSVESIVGLFRAAGYDLCEDGNLETGYQKIAVFTNKDEPTHAARQLSDGKWTSKLGNCEDIVHDTLEELQGDSFYSYGQVALFMARPLADDESPIRSGPTHNYST